MYSTYPTIRVAGPRWLRALVPGGLVLALALPACQTASAEVEPVVQTECGEVMGQEVCTWAQVQDGTLAAFGLTLPMSLVEGVPSEMEMVWPPAAHGTLPMPPAAREAGVTLTTVYWEAHGHPPGPYMEPHFDLHFYYQATEADLAAMDCSDDRKPSAIPAGYAMEDVEMPEPFGTLVGLCVPGMGMHAFPGGDFAEGYRLDATLGVGYYGGEFSFLEPMIARERLQRRESFELPVPAVPGVDPEVVVPGSFAAEYDAEAAAYRFVFQLD